MTPPARSGRRVGRYLPEELLGSGGMGQVWSARDPEGRRVALKLVPIASPQARERFSREQRLQAELGESDGFVPLLDVGVDPDAGPYLVMPLFAGGTLRDRFRKRGSLAIEETRELGYTLSAALARAHAKGIVHRDLKPENILYARPEARLPLIADLGLAKHYDRTCPAAADSQSLSRSGVMSGTVGYCPPEQLQSLKEVGPEADSYALGAVLYECLAGVPPFAGDTFLEVMVSVLEGRIPALEGHRPDVPKLFVALIERCLDTDPKRRPTCEQVMMILAPTAPPLSEARRSPEDDPERPTPGSAGIRNVVGAVQRFIQELLERRSAEGPEDPSSSRQLIGRYKVKGPRPLVFPLPPSPPIQSGRVPAAHGSPQASSDAAAELLRAGRIERALSLLEALTRSHPELALAWANLARARRLSGDAAGGRAALGRALGLGLDRADVWCEVGRISLELGALGVAIRAFERGEHLDPQHEEARGCLRAIWDDLQDYGPPR